MIEGKDLFSVRVNPPYDTVRWRLLCWLLRVKTNFIASVDMTCFQFKNHFLYYFGKPVVSLTEFDQVEMLIRFLKNWRQRKRRLSVRGYPWTSLRL